MSDRIASFDITVQAGTAKSTPVTFPTVFSQGEVVTIDWEVPPGCNGLLGFQFAYGEQVIIPEDSSKWIVTNGTTRAWDVTNFPQGEHWAIIAYNEGNFDHTIQVRYLIDNIVLPGEQAGTGSIRKPPSPIEINSQTPVSP